MTDLPDWPGSQHARSLLPRMAGDPRHAIPQHGPDGVHIEQIAHQQNICRGPGVPAAAAVPRPREQNHHRSGRRSRRASSSHRLAVRGSRHCRDTGSALPPAKPKFFGKAHRLRSSGPEYLCGRHSRAPSVPAAPYSDDILHAEAAARRRVRCSRCRAHFPRSMPSGYTGARSRVI